MGPKCWGSLTSAVLVGAASRVVKQNACGAEMLAHHLIMCVLQDDDEEYYGEDDDSDDDD